MDADCWHLRADKLYFIGLADKTCASLEFGVCLYKWFNLYNLIDLFVGLVALIELCRFNWCGISMDSN